MVPRRAVRTPPQGTDTHTHTHRYKVQRFKGTLWRKEKHRRTYNIDFSDSAHHGGSLTRNVPALSQNDGAWAHE